MDKIQSGLDQKVFNGITPRPRVLKFITDEMRKVLTPILGFDPMEFMDLYLTGSLTTYQYSETSDCDVSVFIKWDIWPTGEDPNTIRKKIIPVVMNKLDGTNLPGTEHPIQHFVVPPSIEPHDLYKPGLRSAFSFRDHKWLVPPEKDRVHDISVELPVMWHRAKLMEDKMNVLLQVNPIYAKEFWHQIHRKRQQDQKAGLGDFCLALGTRVLKADYSWINIEDIEIGDVLVGFDEEVPGGKRRGKQRTFQPAVVRSKTPARLPSYKITTTDGEVVASAAHGWLVRNKKRSLEWRETKDLQPGDTILRFSEVWKETDDPVKAAYLAGIFDGEGHMTKGGRLSFSQKEGNVMAQAQQYLHDLGFGFSSGRSKNRSQDLTYNWAWNMQVYGGVRETMRFLYQIPTVRVGRDQNGWWIGHEITPKNRYVDSEASFSVVLEIEDVGEQEVIGLGTSTGTLIAEGLFSSNSEGNIVYKMLLHDGYFDRIRDELGERISKVAWDENFSIRDFEEGESNYEPPVGSVWTMSDPWSQTRNPPGPNHRTVEVTSVESRYVWYRDLDTQTGLDQQDGMSIRSWNDKMHRGLIYPASGDWQFQESPEEAAEYWPDTLPQNWSRVATTGEPESLSELAPGHQYTLWSPRGLYLLSLPGALPPEGAPRYLTFEGVKDGKYVFNGVQYNPSQVQEWLDKQLLRLFLPPRPDMGIFSPSEMMVPDTLPPNWSKQAATLRLFIAFDPPQETLNEIIQWQQANAPEGVRLHRPEIIHMTLAFLGNIDEEHVPTLLNIIGQLDPSAVTISGPARYEEIRGKQGVLVWNESGGNEVWQQLNQLLHEWSGYTPQYDPWLPHTTVWEYPGGTGEGYTPELPVIAPWTPTGVFLYKSEKAPGGGGQFTMITKTADDLSWVDKSTPYGTPAGGVVTGPEHGGDDSIDLPSEPTRDLVPPDNIGLKDPAGSLKVIYDFERDQIILGDIKKADQFPPGQIIGDYRNGDVYLNSHAEAWFNANYFKRLWQHSFPKRPIRHVILDKGNGQHEVVHRDPTSAILGTNGKEQVEDRSPDQSASYRSEAQGSYPQAQGYIDEAYQEDQAGLEERRQGDSQAQPESTELLQVTSVEEYGEYYWPEPHEIMQAGVDAVEATGQPHPGFRQNAEAAIDSARGAAINRHIGMFGMGGTNDPYELAGHLIWRIQATQMAIDGNKRMAATTGLSWLSMHGYDVTHLPQDDSFYQTVEQSSTMNEDEGPELIANYLHQYVKPEDG